MCICDILRTPVNGSGETVNTLGFKLCRGGDSELFSGNFAVEHFHSVVCPLCPLKGHLPFGAIPYLEWQIL